MTSNTSRIRQNTISDYAKINVPHHYRLPENHRDSIRFDKSEHYRNAHNGLYNENYKPCQKRMKNKETHTPKYIDNTQNNQRYNHIQPFSGIYYPRQYEYINEVKHAPSDGHALGWQNERWQAQRRIPTVYSYEICAERSIQQHYSHCYSYAPQPFDFCHIKYYACVSLGMQNKIQPLR